MKANDFIKKFGWGTSKFCLDICLSPNDKWFIHEGESIYDEDFDELKRLVESYELVELLGGIEEVKELLDLDGLRDSTILRLKQAIADVEACNA